ncbi:MAG: hypothetical protein ACFFA0_02685 [Promethearchaeota archaeon]
MVYEVKNNGEEFKLNLTEEVFRQNNGNQVLHPSQVAIIIKEGLRRIYIWKGISSSVRKKFIASRVASNLQRKLIDSSNFHRCKIVSVDQGDEPQEFLNAFGFQKVPIITDINVTEVQNTSKKLASFNKKVEIVDGKTQKIQKNNIISENTPSYEQLKSNQHSMKILERILKIESPQNFKRKNILIGNNKLYSTIVKKANIFNEHVEEKEWEEILYFQKEIIELEGHRLRIHLNKELMKIEAIEIMEKVTLSEKSKKGVKHNNFQQYTVKELRQFCHENNIKIPSNSRKADIIRLIIEFTTSSL